MDERKLIDALVNNDNAAWRAFVDLYGSVIFTACLHTIRIHRGREDRAEAEDAAQDVLLALTADRFRALRNFGFQSKLSTWLVSVARNRTLMRLRRRELSIRGPVEEAASVPDSGGDDGIAADATVAAAVDRLPERDGRIIKLFYFEQRSYQEIAREMNVSPNSVSPLLTRAREHLRKILK